MILRNLEFSNCWLAAGVMSFFGSGYWYHNLYNLLVPGFETINDLTFVAKTTTLEARTGNMTLNSLTYQPTEWLPKCIKVYPRTGAMLNAVGLSGPGADKLLRTGNWQKVDRPFWLSFMAISDQASKRLEEMHNFCQLLSRHLPFSSPLGLQINLSCPNVNHDTNNLSQEAVTLLKAANQLGLPLDIKINPFVKNEVIKNIEASGLCDILTIGNTIPYGSPGINWQKISGSTSPLSQYGGGGLSGQPIFHLVINKIESLRANGINMPIKGGGGIMSVTNVLEMALAGANAIEIATVLALRPWRVKKIIAKAQAIF